MRVRVGDHEETLHEGDSIFYKSSTPHGMIAVDGAGLRLPRHDHGEHGGGAGHRRPSPGRRRRSSPSSFCVRHFVHAGGERGRHVSSELHFAHEDEFNFAFDIVDGIAQK